MDRISVKIDFSKEDNGYKDLFSPRLLKFFLLNIQRGNNLIQTQVNKPFYCDKATTLHLRAIPVSSWYTRPKWSDIKCRTVEPFIKSSPCEVGTRQKVFVKLKGDTFAAGFASYLLAIYTHKLNKSHHMKFVSALQNTFQHNPILIHNQDVDWFHLKQF